MSITEGQQPDDDGWDDELPSKFLIFTCPDLDQDEQKARKAGSVIDRILRAIVGGLSDLEDVERALRQAEPTSTRARHAREHLRHALSQTDDLIEGVSNAEGALIFHWNRTPTSPRTECCPQFRPRVGG